MTKKVSFKKVLSMIGIAAYNNNKTLIVCFLSDLCTQKERDWIEAKYPTIHNVYHNLRVSHLKNVGIDILKDTGHWE